MRNILTGAHRQILKEFVSSNVLVALDYDGTLAPIVTDPDLARMRKTTIDLLRRLTDLYQVIVISGRAQPDALRKLRGTGVFEVVGNHGIEPWHAARRHIDQVKQWLPAVNGHLTSLPGVLVEDKIYSLAIHYRRSREKKRARAAILELVAKLGPARIIGGKQVVNILPEGAPHKGIALERERGRLQCDTAIFVGDDETDEDVFALDQPGRLLTVRVGRKKTSAAHYFIPDQRSMDELLRTLIEFRRAPQEDRRRVA
jgi:trehalose 6-phosphate phosphatase